MSFYALIFACIGGYSHVRVGVLMIWRVGSCGHFMAMIFGDYVAGFLGLGRDGNSWSMNPFDVSSSLLYACDVHG